MTVQRQFRPGKSDSRGIEWTDATWNPVGGCHHDCRWEMPDGTTAICYAKGVAERLAQAAYPHGFEHVYWRPHKLTDPARQHQPHFIFVDSMSDLMAKEVTTDHIEQVFDAMRLSPHHTFQLLTKNAPRLLQFKNDFPQNLWVGVSSPPDWMYGRRLTSDQQARMLTRSLEVLSQIKVPITWMSFEPLSWDVAELLGDPSSIYRAIRWAVIGAATNGRNKYQPEPAHVARLLTKLDGAGVPVFLKGNLSPDLVTEWREDMPWVINNEEAIKRRIRIAKDYGWPVPCQCAYCDKVDFMATRCVKCQKLSCMIHKGQGKMCEKCL